MYSILGIEFSTTTIIAGLIALIALFLFKRINKKAMLREYELKKELCHELDLLQEELKGLCTDYEYELFQIQFEKHFYTNREKLRSMSSRERIKYSELILKEEILKRKAGNTQLESSNIH